MMKLLKDKLPLIAMVGVGALSLGVVASLLEAGVFREAPPVSEAEAPPQEAVPDWVMAEEPESPVLQLATVPPHQRAEKLTELADQSSELEQNRAQYLLAVDRINQGQGGSAIPLLQDLEQSYEPMAPMVLLKLGQAQAAAGQADAAKETWSRLLRTHRDHPVGAEALYALGQTDASYWEQMIERFPAHPRSVEVARKNVIEATNPANTLKYLQVIARHGTYLTDYGSFLDRLVGEYGDQLSPDDWQAVGFGYWEIQRYGKAGSAYAKAPLTPINAYRAARGMQIGERWDDAIAAYERLNQQFPNAPETATGMLRLADMVSSEKALSVLDQVINRFPDRAPEALLERAAILDALNSQTSANQARESLLSQYSQSEPAAELRLQRARQAAASQNLQAAYDWGLQVVKYNPTSEVAAEAAFWAGKWAQKLGQTSVAQDLFEWTIGHHPDSYYAWRSATMSGWDVGDFTTVRALKPEVSLPSQRTPLPVGSDTLRELHMLGQDVDAWTLWQVEFTSLQTPTVKEQFTDGLLRLGVGDNLDGIYMVSSLAWREIAEEKAQYAALKQQDAYWQALYPFPFAQLIETWSAQRQLNPLLVMALVRQESRFEPQIESVAGALGLMQVMPSTADWIKEKAGLTSYDLKNPEDNVKLGTWYLDYTHQEYSNHSLFAVASYNAGPGNVADWIAQNNYQDLDEFVEVIPFPETQDYVKSVLGGYWNYLRLYNPTVAKQVQRQIKLATSNPPASPLK